MTLTEDLLEQLRSNPPALEAIRRELLTEELLEVPARLATLTSRVESLAAAQERTEERLGELTAAVERLTAVVGGVSDWQRGDEGRRSGEKYERDTIRHAYAIFSGGRGAAERPEDLDRIRRAIYPVVASDAGLAEADDPFLADLLWLKSDRVAVVEVSRQVDTSDVERARKRAATLNSAGVPALAVVIGRDWASDAAEYAARDRQVEWRVAEDGSSGYLSFRRAADA